jgi:hypothetical protein
MVGRGGGGGEVVPLINVHANDGSKLLKRSCILRTIEFLCVGVRKQGLVSWLMQSIFASLTFFSLSWMD